MRKNPFDEVILNRIQTERIQLTQEADMHIQEKMMRATTARRPRATAVHRPLRFVLAVLAVLLLLGGTALAAAHWGSRALITHTEGKDGSGQEQVNEVLVSHIQPVGDVFQGDSLSIDIVDAIFEGNSLVAAWTLTNNGLEPAYIYCDMLVNGTSPGIGGYTNVDELFIEPGETIHSGISARIDGENPGVAVDACDVQMTFTAFYANGEVVEIGALHQGEDANAYRQRIEALLAEGKIPLAPDGVIELTQLDLDMGRAENLEASGLMRKVDVVNASFSVERNTQPLTDPSAWEPVEKDNGTYTLRVVEADVNLNSATFRLERIFPNKAAVDKFEAYYEKLGPGWTFRYLDETGDAWWKAASSGGDDTQTPQEQADGTWVWGYTTQMINLNRIPQTITIIPVRDNPETGDYAVEFPEEAITISIK